MQKAKKQQLVNEVNAKLQPQAQAQPQQSRELFGLITIRSHENMASAIKRIRRLRGLSQMDLSKKTGLTQATISRVENESKKVEIGTLFLILTALNTDLMLTPRTKAGAPIYIESKS